MLTLPDTYRPTYRPFERWSHPLYVFSIITDKEHDYVVQQSDVEPGIVGFTQYFSFETLSEAYDWLEEQGADYLEKVA